MQLIYEISKEKVEGGCGASCYINGELYGEGVGRNLDTAKTKAAWRAFYSILHGQPNFEPGEYNESLTLFIRETPKRIFFWQTMKTQMKCSIMLHLLCCISSGITLFIR